MKRKKSEGGFTLTQLMLGVMSLGVMLTLACKVRIPESDRQRVNITKAMLRLVASQLDIFKLDHGRYPDNLDDMVDAPNYVKSGSYPPEGYLEELPMDGWGNHLIYRRLNSSAKPFVLMSCGADCVEGGEDKDADITLEYSRK